jgi:alpha-mannosidase
MERPADGLEQVTQKWFDLTGRHFGFALLNDSRYGCDALGGRARVTLVRNAFSPDPDSDAGRHRVTLGFLPHGPEFRPAWTIRQAILFNRPPVAVLARQPARKTPPPIELEGAGHVVCTALRNAEKIDGIIVRLFNAGAEPARCRLRFNLSVQRVEYVNLREDPIPGTRRPRGRMIDISFRPFEIKTLRAQRRQPRQPRRKDGAKHEK